MKLNPLSSYGWNEAAARYVNTTTGRFVPFKAVKLEFEAVVQRSAANIEAVSNALVSGDITLAEWQLVMEREIKISQTASAAAARGGWAQMSQSDWGWVGSQVKEQYQYLRRFAGQIASGKERLNGHLIARAKMYGMAARSTFEDMRRREAAKHGGIEERRVLMPGAEHCQDNPARGTRGCAELARLGWQPAGTLPGIGSATCVMHCQCYFEIRDKSGRIL